MKTTFLYLLTATFMLGFIWLSGCASSKSMAYDPAGAWNYTVSGTPNGTVNGTMVISKRGDAYSGEMRTTAGSASLDNLQIDGQTMTANLMYQGTNLELKGSFEQDTFTGEVVAGYDSFDMAANRSN
ncbi:MAG: hypothetical protein RIG62_11275 [Cyclobacteriaceae bacterium]